MLLSYFNATYIEAGCDEAGRGCLAGPVMAAAVVLPKNYKNKVLNDSKQLSHEQREELREEIIEKALFYAIAEASPAEIDQINILNASFLAMHRAIAELSKSQVPEHLLIDGNRFSPYTGIPHTCIIKGDGKYASIAAASILAKTSRDRIMVKLSESYPDYGWERNFGYPTLLHKKAIEKHGCTPYHRLSFKMSL
jgi:ribonuclease HII